MTEYIVLKSNGETWERVDSVEASGARQAIKLATDGQSAEARTGVFVAVPERSWNPEHRQVETKEVDRWA